MIMKLEHSCGGTWAITSSANNIICKISCLGGASTHSVSRDSFSQPRDAHATGPTLLGLLNQVKGRKVSSLRWRDAWSHGWYLGNNGLLTEGLFLSFSLGEALRFPPRPEIAVVMRSESDPIFVTPADSDVRLCADNFISALK